MISPSGEPGVTDYSHRRSRVLMELGPHEQVILNRIRGVLPKVLEQLGMEEFPITRTEVQITASNDGDFFHAHCDDAQEVIASRRMTFVYFFHREPNQFEGGELRLHDSRKRASSPQHGRLPDHCAAAEPDRIFPVLDIARNHSRALPVAGFRRQSVHGERMAAPVKDTAWLEWIAGLMGAASRQRHTATMLPHQFHCLLDELPLHLVPQHFLNRQSSQA